MSSQNRSHTSEIIQQTFTPKNYLTKRGRKYIPRNVNYTPTLTIWEPTDWVRYQGVVQLNHDELEALRLKNINGLSVISGAKQMGISKSLFANIYKAANKKVTNALIYGKSLYVYTGEIDDMQEPLLSAE